MNAIFYKLGIFLLLNAVCLMPAGLWSQCENASVALPDFSQPVANPSNLYCVEFTVDPTITGHPTGISMHLVHSWQGDLSIRVFACGNTLMLLTRPGGGTCGGGCPCGNPSSINGVFTFGDTGPNPDNGLAFGGGDYGLSGDPCNVNTVNSFAELGAACGTEPYTFTICIGDHAGGDIGHASDIFPLFAEMPVCGCTDPAASNYDPNANVDDGSCEYPPCELIAEVELFQPTCSEPLGNAILSVEGGSGDYLFEWNPNVSSDFVGSELEPGSYEVLIADENDPDCSIEINFVILEPQGLEFEYELSPTSCDLSNGSIYVFPQGLGPYSYDWSGPEPISGSGSDDLAAGTYSLTITDETSGCEVEANFEIQPSSPLSFNQYKENANCDGSPGYINILMQGGSGSYIFEWTPNVSNSHLANDLEQGSYTVVVSDANIPGCSEVIEFSIEMEGELELSALQENTSCGLPNGSIDLSANSENPIQFNWSGPSQGSGSYSDNLQAGSYEISGLDPMTGCYGTISVFLVDSEPVEATGIAEHPECGDDNGSLFVFAQGGSGYYQYEWNPNVSNNSEAHHLPPGLYEVTITDQNDPECYDIVWAELIPSGDIELEYVIQHSSCGLENGIIEFFTPPGAGPYEFHWDGPTAAFGEKGENLASGFYQIIISDSESDCDGVLVLEVEPSEPAELLAEITHAQCSGEGGYVQLSIWGGEGHFDFFWTPEVSFSDYAENLLSGTYHVLALNAETGCTAEVNFEILVEGTLGIEYQLIHPSCEASDGAIELISPTAGQYQFEWTGPVDLFGQNPTNLPAGLYSVTVTDEDKSCSEILELELSGPAAFEVNYEIESTSCGLNNGSISLLPDMSGSYSYIWNDSGLSALPQLSGLSPGMYEVEVTDTISGCSRNIQLHIEESESLNAVLEEKCLENGLEYFLSGKILNGSAPYTILNNTIQIDVNGDSLFSETLQSGETYQFVIRDDLGCETPLISGFRDCDCLTSAGDMPGVGVEVCADQPIVVQYIPGSSNNTGSDVFEYILFEELSDPINSILLFSSIGEFYFDSTIMDLNRDYYIAHAASIDDGAGRPDYDRACLDISNAQTVRWLAYPYLEEVDFQTECGFQAEIYLGESFDGLEWELIQGPGSIVQTELSGGIFRMEVSDAGRYTLEFTAQNSGKCFTTFSWEREFYGFPFIAEGPEIHCIEGTHMYYLTLQIQGGSGGYSVLSSSPVGGNISGGVFTSENIDSGTPFGFEFTDSESCDIISSSGVGFCNCPGQVGQIDSQKIELCYGSPLELNYSDAGEMIGHGDSLIFVLYGSDSGHPSDVILISADPLLAMPAGVVPGKSYFAAASVIPFSPDGNPNWNAECHSQSNWVEVIWYRQPAFSINEPDILDCIHLESLLSLQLEENEETGTLSFYWSDANGPIEGSSNKKDWKVSINGWYYIDIVNAGNCQSRDSVFLDQDIKSPENIALNFLEPACFGEKNGAIWVDSVEGGVGPYTFSFNGSDFNNEKMWSELTAGHYLISVLGANGCDKTFEFTLTQPEKFVIDLGQDQTIERGEELMIFPSILPSNSTVTQTNWVFKGETIGDALQIELNLIPQSSGVLKLEAFNAFGCHSSDSIRLEIRENYSVYIPNAFSPNDDGINDFFRAYLPPSAVFVHEFSVFDRWGNKIFERKNSLPDDSGLLWDGSFKGQSLNTGLFIYLLDLEFFDGRTQRFIGDVLLMR